MHDNGSDDDVQDIAHDPFKT